MGIVKRKLCSTMLIVAMLLTIIPRTAFAQGSVKVDGLYSRMSALLDAKLSEKLTDAEYKKMYEENIILSDQMTFLNDFLTDIHKGGDGHFVFEVKIDESINEISVLQKDEEK